MPRAPKSPLTAIIAYAMNAPLAEVQQAVDTIKTIAKQRQEQGLKEPALPLKVAKPRRKKKPAAPPTTQLGPTEVAAPVPVVGAAQAAAAAQSPIRGTRGPGIGRRRPAVGGAVAEAAAPAVVPPVDAAAPGALPDQAVDPSHVE